MGEEGELERALDDVIGIWDLDNGINNKANLSERGRYIGKTCLIQV